ncbi:hypothetical protein LINGRAHAP2_LOCUS24713 [Linum grandiflorum]
MECSSSLLLMLRRSFFCLSAFSFIADYPIFTYGNFTVNSNVLIPGNELLKETLPLQKGSRLYELQGLKSNSWYEVKISYPASIPASFTIQLKKDVSDLGSNRNRRLLNTEKLIFKADSFNGSQQNKLYVLVSVQPEGVVAIPNILERQAIIFNIVCDELLMGIPHKAWWVGFLVLLCLVAAFITPRFLPTYMLPKKGSCKSSHENVPKES